MDRGPSMSPMSSFSKLELLLDPLDKYMYKYQRAVGTRGKEMWPLPRPKASA